MKNIYLMRHGQTIFNLKNLIQGACDSPLTKEGIEQVNKTKKFLKENEFAIEKYYSSDLGRAKETADILSDGDYSIDKRIREQSFGIFEGESGFVYPGHYVNIDEDEAWEKAGIESKDEATERFKNFLLDISKRAEYQNMLMVSHGAIMRLFLKSLDCEISPITNCMILQIQCNDEEFKLVKSIDPLKD